jgi:alpha-tubulin suppressor-like RCC1 family protein
MEELRDHRVCQVVAGCHHCAASTEDGALFTWQTQRVYTEDEAVPELGYDHLVQDNGVPRRVCALEGMRITWVAVGVMSQWQ